MHYYLYQITNKINGKIYIGVHSTSNLDDAYMGSGKSLRAAYKKYGFDNFEKNILEFFDTESDMYAREKILVTERFVDDRSTYNLNIGGYGGWHAARKTAQSSKANSRRSKTLKGTGIGNKNSQYGTMWITDGIVNKKIKKTNNIPESWKKGFTVPKGWGKNISQKLKGRSHIELFGEEKASELSRKKSESMKGNTRAKSRT